jgi:hypothetical protein
MKKTGRHRLMQSINRYVLHDKPLMTRGVVKVVLPASLEAMQV